MGRRRGGSRGMFGGGKRSLGGLFGKKKPSAPSRPKSTSATKTKSKTSSRSNVSNPPAAAPKSTPAAPMSTAPAVSGGGGGGMLSGLGSTLMQGMAFGAGSAVAHRAIDGVAGPRTVQHEWADGQGNAAEAGGNNNAAPAAGSAMAASNDVDACLDFKQNFASCVGNNPGDVGACQFLFDQLTRCQADAKDNAQW